MQKNILLSILIPTYNRLSFLETTVGCFVQQIKLGGLENSVEILIGNDYLKDKTNKYIQQISAENNFVYGWTHPKNLGLSGNIEWLAEKAQGTYILTSGDDDLMRDGAVSYFINCIQSKKPNFILVNTSNIISNDKSNKDFTVVLENRLNIYNDIFVENFDRDKYMLKPAKDWLYLTNLLPAVVFKKDLWQKEMVNAKKYVRPENLWLWQGPVIIGIRKYGRLLVVGNCFVLHRKNETNWTKDPRTIVYLYTFDTIEISRLLKHYMPTEYKRHKKLYASFLMEDLIRETKKGRGLRKFTWYAFYNNFDCFPENIQFLTMAIAPKLITHISQALRKLKSVFSLK